MMNLAKFVVQNYEKKIVIELKEKDWAWRAEYPYSKNIEKDRADMQRIEGTIKKTFLVDKDIVDAIKKKNPRGLNEFARKAFRNQAIADKIIIEQDDQK